MSVSEPNRTREALVAERADTLERMRDMSRNFDAIVESTRDVATDDEHDPEGQTIAFERAQAATLIRQASDHIELIDRALDRMDAGTYGRCERCGGIIAAERLVVRPAAVTCVACA